MYWFRRLFRKINNFFWYGWKLRNQVDWECDGIWEMMAIKYRKVYEEMKKDEMYAWTSDTKQMRRLNIMVVACERLAWGDYHQEEAPKMINVPRQYFTTPGGIELSTLGLEYRTPQDRKLAMRLYKKANERRIADIDTVTRLLKKYNDRWWT